MADRPGEVPKEVRTVMVSLTCGQCLQGAMLPTGVIKPMAPPLFVHQCDKCGATVNVSHKYPYFEYEPM